MKTLIVVAACFIVALFAGCRISEEKKDEIKAKVQEAIIKIIEEKGQETALAHVDQLLEEGKIGKVTAEKIKKAIPEGVEKIKEILKKDEINE